MVQKSSNIEDQNLSTLENKNNSNNNQSESIKLSVPDPQVKGTKTPKQKLTKAYKLKILTAYDACKDGSERASLLRREGLYHSHVGAWRKRFGLTNDESKGELKSRRTEHMLREIEQLKKKLSQAEAILDLQKKVFELLGTHILPHESKGVNS